MQNFKKEEKKTKKPEQNLGEEQKINILYEQLPLEIPVPNSTDKIILISPDLGDPHKPFYNLSRVNKNGEVVWVAELPNDAYVDRPFVFDYYYSSSSNHDCYVSIGVERDVSGGDWLGRYRDI